MSDIHSQLAHAHTLSVFTPFPFHVLRSIPDATVCV